MYSFILKKQFIFRSHVLYCTMNIYFGFSGSFNTACKTGLRFITSNKLSAQLRLFYLPGYAEAIQAGGVLYTNYQHHDQ